jgi:hypothetical protein
MDMSDPVLLTVVSGACGFTATVEARADDEEMVHFTIGTACQNIARLAATLPSVDPLTELGAGFEGDIHRAARQAIPRGCGGCPVPAGLFKAMQTAAGLALPVSAEIRFEG